MADAKHTPERGPWKGTSLHIAPSHVYIMALALDHMYPLEAQTQTERRALDACIARGWIVHRAPECQYSLTETGRHVAIACRAVIHAAIDARAAIAKATGSAS